MTVYFCTVPEPRNSKSSIGRAILSPKPLGRLSPSTRRPSSVSSNPIPVSLLAVCPLCLGVQASFMFWGRCHWMGAHPRGSFNFAAFAEGLFPVDHSHRFCWLGSLGATVQHRTGRLVSSLSAGPEGRAQTLEHPAECRSWRKGSCLRAFPLCGHWGKPALVGVCYLAPISGSLWLCQQRCSSVLEGIMASLSPCLKYVRSICDLF